MRSLVYSVKAESGASPRWTSRRTRALGHSSSSPLWACPSVAESTMRTHFRGAKECQRVGKLTGVKSANNEGQL